ncbi:DUF7490 domain-containing protein [Halospeciosus flavus]|uniref:PGF-CTERM sorting domain-containing protein n=1 Tax=Halospeciosus flavus TaxID=3032283 RepID=A0ABD5Z4R3_9EURY|nr:PGF-CTERM sorting domain-containing protein [Halospeciosus flavus]
MNRERLLAGAVVALVCGAVLAAVLVPGATVSPRTEPDRPSHLDFREMTISPAQVSGETATLSVRSYVRHRGGTAENVTLLLRAVDSETGFVTARTPIDVGNVSADEELAINGSLTVERSGGYRIDAILYRNGSRVSVGRKTVSGLSALTPEYARSPVQFHDFGRVGLPPVAFSIDSAANNRTTLDVHAYLTNTGNRSGDLRVAFVARQADSNIVADRATVDVGAIRPGRTVSPSTTLEVPSEYNYYLDAVLWKDGVIVGVARSTAKLDPTETVPQNQTREEVELSVSDFEQSSERETAGEPERTRTASGASPGFGVPAAVVALAGVVIFTRRWSA